MRLTAISQYSFDNPIDKNLRLYFRAVNPVVLLPENMSRMVSLSSVPASMHGIIKAGGYVAKWARLFGLVYAIINTFGKRIDN